MDGYHVNDRPPSAKNERKYDWLAIIAMLPVFVAIWHFSTQEKALATSGTLFLFYVLISVMWNCRREKWFWLAIAVLVLIHVAVIWLVPFQLPTGPSLTYVLPIMMADGFAMFGVLRWLEVRRLI